MAGQTGPTAEAWAISGRRAAALIVGTLVATVVARGIATQATIASLGSTSSRRIRRCAAMAS